MLVQVGVGLAFEFEMVSINFDFLLRNVEYKWDFTLLNINYLTGVAFILAFHDSNDVTGFEVLRNHWHIHL